MGQVISNLVVNAITYGDPQTPMRVHGKPIPAELMPVLFEPLRRGVPEDRSPRGLGLGLYIVHQIVLAHDCTVKLRALRPL